MLNDRDNNEIYSNYIIQSLKTEKNYIAKFNSINGLRFFNEHGNYVCPIEPISQPQKNILVIGNLFENPEIMCGENKNDRK